MRARPGLQAFLGGRAADLQAQGGRLAWRLFLGGREAFLGRLSLNRIFCSKDSLLPLLRKSQKYKT